MATKTATARPAFATVEDFIADISRSKSAEANTEAGSIGGTTTHPVKSVIDNTRTPAPEGARSAENEQDVEEDQGRPGVDSTSLAKAKKAAEEAEPAAGSAEDDQIQIGTRKAPTGEDASVETASAKPGKEDGGTYQGASTHPARTDNEALNGGKYAADFASMPLPALYDAMSKIGNDLLADIAAAAVPHTAASRSTKTAAAANQTVAITPEMAQQMGWEMAGIITGSMDKQAADVMVKNEIVQLIKLAEEDADNVAVYLNEFYKHAGEQAGDPSEGGPGGPMGNGSPVAMGGDPARGAGDLSAGGDSSGDADDLQQISELLQQLHLSPEQLLAALQGEAGGAGGAGGLPPGGDPTGGAGASPAAALAAAGPGGGAAGPQPGPGGMEVAASYREQTKAAVHDVLKELVGRSRAKSASEAVAAAK